VSVNIDAVMKRVLLAVGVRMDDYPPPGAGAPPGCGSTPEKKLPVYC